jgi:2-(1,2-epoxy-1,2-dihydrophenyl)acetyl-CoA isomerase
MSTSLPLQHDSGIEWQVEDGIGRLVLNDPEHANTIGYAQSKAWPRAFSAVVDASPRVIVISARGRIFCAGGDIAGMTANADKLSPYIAETLEPLHAGFVKLASAPCPVVSIINGPIGGAGIGMALCADFVLASTTLRLRAGYPAIGLSPDLGASYFLARRVGAMQAQRWLMTNTVVTAGECLAAGAVDELHTPEALDAAAAELVDRLRHAAPASMAAIKQLCASAGRLDLAAHIELEKSLLSSCAATVDAREGVTAFIEKRSPRFTGEQARTPPLHD